MTTLIDKAVAALNDRIAGDRFDGTAKFVLDGAGSIVIDETGARAAEAPADVTLTATAEVFEEILTGTLNPTAAFMSGKLSVDGDMGAAMRLGSLLA